MKVFQVFCGFCHWDATRVHPTLESTEGLYAPDIKFVEAPDYVFEGWGFDETKEGDDRFIMPSAPEGFEYDPETGTFYDPNAIEDTFLGDDEDEDIIAQYMDDPMYLAGYQQALLDMAEEVQI